MEVEIHSTWSWFFVDFLVKKTGVLVMVGVRFWEGGKGCAVIRADI